jgi:hypothetical protein
MIHHGGTEGTENAEAAVVCCLPQQFSVSFVPSVSPW